MLRLFVSLACMLNFLCFADSCPQCKCGGNILEGKISSNNHRYNTFIYALNLLCEREAAIIVETGTARNGLKECELAGCSTMIFAEWVKNHGGQFYSVDISAESLQNAFDDLGESRSYANLVLSDSVVFLQRFNKPIDFLYLDSFDYEFGNPRPSQEHHLKEIIAAYPWLSSKSVVMIDDCALPGGGKGQLAIEYLLARGWKILHASYQVILSQQ